MAEADQDAPPSADTAHSPDAKLDAQLVSDAQSIPDSGPTTKPSRYHLDFSTYLGSSGKEQLRNVQVDGVGNIYVAGGTWSADFYRTLGPTFGGVSDAVVMKLDPRLNG